MDEPFSALDPLIRRQLQDEFIRLAAIMKKTTVFITHDLDEAVRIGDRIAIMRDGRVVQTGTAGEIVMNPADDYVSDFVAGISRLKIVRAHAVMQSVDQYRQDNGISPQSDYHVGPDEALHQIIKTSITTEAPIVVEQDNNIVGVITRKQILETIMQGAETS